MVRTFSIHSKQISEYLGSAFLNSARIAVVSPWISDIIVRFPDSDQTKERELQLSQAVSRFDVDVTFVVDPAQDQHNRFRSRAILPRIQDDATIRAVENLHAKAIVTDQILYQGSANVTHRGLNINVELCDLRENEYGDVDTFLRQRLGLVVS